MNGTPIFDIKPYLPFTDCHPEATGGFASEQLQTEEPLQVEIPQQAATLYGMYTGKALTMFNLPLEITSVYERNYPERTLRLLTGTMGGNDERIFEEGSQ